MKRKLLAFVGVLAFAAPMAAIGQAVLASNEHEVCASATAPGYTVAAHTIADNGTGVYTIPGQSQPDVVATHCETYTDQTVTVTTTAGTTTAPTPPPPPAGKQHVKGPLRIVYGNDWGLSTTAQYERYGAVVVGYGDDAKVAALQTKGFAYRLMAEAKPCANDSDCESGLSQQTSDAAGCSLKNSSGAYLARGTYHLLDVGSAGCQQRWIDNVKARLDTKGLDGLFVDNLLCDFADELSDNGPAAKYPTAAAERAAVLSFVKNVSTQLQADGKYVLTNTFCWGDGSAASNTAWWSDVAPYPNGLITETFEQNPSGANYYDLRYDCPSCSWMGDWKARLDVITAAGSADAWELTSAIDSSSAAGKAVAKYGCASLLLKWNGTGGGCGVNTGGSDPYDAAGWAFPIGTPTGAMTASGLAFYRSYSGGKVIVNPSTSTQTVLGVTLPAKSAYIGA